MEARAVLRYARISPRKVKIVLDLINKPANVAMGILNNTPKAASEYLTKLLRQRQTQRTIMIWIRISYTLQNVTQHKVLL